MSDESDTVHAYEVRGKEKSTPTSQYDKGLQALSNMNRLQQVEVLHGQYCNRVKVKDFIALFNQVLQQERHLNIQLMLKKHQILHVLIS